MSKRHKHETSVRGNIGKLTQIGRVEGNVTIQSETPNAINYEESISQARALLAVAAYPQAREVLNESLRVFPLDEQAHLMYALASIANRFADDFQYEEVRQIEAHLQIARAKPSVSTYYVATVALAVIRKDYYEKKCQAAPHLPRFEQLASEIQSMKPSPMDFELLKHIKATSKASIALNLGVSSS